MTSPWLLMAVLAAGVVLKLAVMMLASPLVAMLGVALVRPPATLGAVTLVLRLLQAGKHQSLLSLVAKDKHVGQCLCDARGHWHVLFLAQVQGRREDLISRVLMARYLRKWMVDA